MKLALLAILVAASAGCAFHRTVEETYDLTANTYDRTTFTGIVWLNRTAVQGLTVGKRSSGGSTTLAINKGSTETQADAIKAAGEAIGAGIAAGVKKSIIP